jgi:hypothetical protein
MARPTVPTAPDRRRLRPAAALTGLVTLAWLTAAPGPAGSRAEPPSAPPQTTAVTTVTATVLAEAAVVRPSGVAPAADGTTFVSEEVTALVHRISPDGSRSRLPRSFVAPAGLHLTADGALYVADGGRVATIAADGTEGDIPIAGAGLLGWVGLDAAGAMYTLDRNPNRLVRVDPDGTQEVLALTTTNQVVGLDVATDGTVSVLDVETGEVIRRAPDGTETTIAVAGAEVGQSVDVEGDRIVVGGAAGVIVREADGTTAQVIDRGLAHQVVLQADGTVWAAFTGITGCRCPEPAGSVVRAAPDGSTDLVPLGDLVDFGSVAAGPSGSVLYTSWNGPQGYSDLNPLRRIEADGTSTDLPITDALVVDAAPDGTQLLLLRGSSSATTVLARRDVEGTVTPIDLPTEPGLDRIGDISVDADGTVYVAMASNYGTGPFRILEVPVGGGMPTVRYRGDGEAGLLAAAAGGGRLVLAVTAGGATQLLDVDASGAATERAQLIGTITAFEVDASGPPSPRSSARIGPARPSS